MSFIQNIDNWLFVLINQTLAHANLDFLMIGLSNPKIWIPFYIIIVVFSFLQFKTNAWVVLIGFVAVFALSDSISSKFFKPTFKRTRPCNETYLNPRTPDGISKSFGFVSSHAANHMAIAVFLIMAFNLKKGFKAAIFLWAILIAYSRVYLGKHYVSDVFCGALLGGIISYIIWKYTVLPLSKKLNLTYIK